MLAHLNLGHNKISRISGLDSLPLTHLCLVRARLCCCFLVCRATQGHSYTHTENMSRCVFYDVPPVPFYSAVQGHIGLTLADHHMVR